MKFNLYVTDWSPNGTNDLLVAEKIDQIFGFKPNPYGRSKNPPKSNS